MQVQNIQYSLPREAPSQRMVLGKIMKSASLGQLTIPMNGSKPAND